MPERPAVHPIEHFFDHAEQFIISRGYQWEIDLVQNRYFKNIDSNKLAWEFTFCALGSSGLNNKVVQKQYDEIFHGNSNFNSIKNHRIREAIELVWKNRVKIFNDLQMKITDKEKIENIRTLPQMGPKTSYHFARNIGIDCIKPDIWMKRIADHYGYYE